MLLQRELFLTMFYTINRSPLLVTTKQVCMLTINNFEWLPIVSSASTKTRVYFSVKNKQLYHILRDWQDILKPIPKQLHVPSIVMKLGWTYTSLICVFHIKGVMCCYCVSRSEYGGRGQWREWRVFLTTPVAAGLSLSRGRQAAANHNVVGRCLCAFGACMPRLVSRARPGKPVNVILESEVSVQR